MNFNKHFDYEGHAPFSPSSPAWFRYSKTKISSAIDNKDAAAQGTRLHAWAAETIQLGRKQPRRKDTLCQYVNDAIGFGMSTEVKLVYSPRCWGTTDAIDFDEDDNFLRIHDLKTGVTPASMDQLVGYAALFCLEYGRAPEKIKIELRIYQNNEVTVCVPDPAYVRSIMNQCILVEDVYQAKLRGEVITDDR